MFVQKGDTEHLNMKAFALRFDIVWKRTALWTQLYRACHDTATSNSNSQRDYTVSYPEPNHTVGFVHAWYKYCERARVRTHLPR